MCDIPEVTTRGLVWQNQNGGFFLPGCMYGLPRKFAVGQICLQLWQLSFLTRLSSNELAREANVGWHYANKVISEINLKKEIIDPAEIRLGKTSNGGLETNSPPRKTYFFFLFLSKSQIDPIWIIAKSSLPTMARISHPPLFPIILPRLGPAAVSIESRI
jgi:hypothetical protein